MSDFNEILALDAIGQGEMIRSGEVTALELVDAAISNIEELNPTLNAVVIPMFDEARAVAQQPLPEGPLSGVPFLLKNMVAEYAGTPYTASSSVMSGNVSQEDSEIVRRYKRAGLVTLGKTNAPLFAYGPATEPGLYGPTLNPWNTELSCGGSSGGSGAAVAAGFVAMAHGNDGGGSIRIPASCCGLVGMKPTRGRNPLGPQHGEVWGGLIAEHVMTRSVRDTAAALDVTAGPDLGAPYWAAPDSQTYLSATREEPRRLRIGFTDRTYSGDDIHPDSRAAVHATARLCAELGHSVEQVTLPIDGDALFRGFTALLAASASAVLLDLSRRAGRQFDESDFEPLFWGLALVGGRMSAADYIVTQQDLHKICLAIGRFHQGYDVLITPTLGTPPPRIGEFAMESGGDPIAIRQRMWAFAPFAQLQNVTGQPAISLPLHWNGDGLPIGSHFVGRYGDEITLLRLAAQLEAANDWHDRWPPLPFRR
jgi:amidase